MHSKQNSENLQKKEWLEADTRGIFRHGHNFSGEGARFPHSPDNHAKWETTEVWHAAAQKINGSWLRFRINGTEEQVGRFLRCFGGWKTWLQVQFGEAAEVQRAKAMIREQVEKVVMSWDMDLLGPRETCIECSHW